MDFFERVKTLAKQKNLTLRGFIESLGINYDTYYSGKRLNNLPRSDEAVRIAQALNTTVEYLVTGKTQENSLDKTKTLELLQQTLDIIKKS